MSHAYGRCRFDADGTIMHFEYDGTSDLVCRRLRISAQEVSDHWRTAPSWDIPVCICGKSESAQLACDYGGGSNWT